MILVLKCYWQSSKIASQDNIRIGHVDMMNCLDSMHLRDCIWIPYFNHELEIRQKPDCFVVELWGYST